VREAPTVIGCRTSRPGHGRLSAAPERQRQRESDDQRPANSTHRDASTKDSHSLPLTDRVIARAPPPARYCAETEKLLLVNGNRIRCHWTIFNLARCAQPRAAHQGGGESSLQHLDL
jgi:hypothetical protein